MRDGNGDRMGVLGVEVMRSPGMFGFDMRLFLSSDECGSMGKVIAIAEPIAFKKYKRGDTADSCIHIDKKDVQAFMDSLWSSGVRPSNGEGNVGQIGAMTDHLCDLKKDKDFYQKAITKAMEA